MVHEGVGHGDTHLDEHGDFAQVLGPIDGAMLYGIVDERFERRGNHARRRELTRILSGWRGVARERGGEYTQLRVVDQANGGQNKPCTCIA